MNVYVCSICHETNAAVRLQCQSCGTVPASYTLDKRAHKSWKDDTETVAANGCLRLENTRTARVYLRTVPMDYYAV